MGVVRERAKKEPKSLGCWNAVLNNNENIKAKNVEGLKTIPNIMNILMNFSINSF